MISRKTLVLISLLASLVPVPAQTGGEAEFPVSDEIEFTPGIKAAFDRSGQHITHHSLPDGSVMANHHGSAGHITLARINTNGVLESFCNTDEAAARAWMAGENLRSDIAELETDSEKQ